MVPYQAGVQNLGVLPSQPSIQCQMGFELMPHLSSCQALLGDQYGPCLIPQRIEEKEWEALRAQLTSRPRDLELVARHFQRDDNAIPPSYVLQSAGSVEAPGPEEATLTSVLQGGAQEARRLGLLSQEQWKRYHRSGEAQGTPKDNRHPPGLQKLPGECTALAKPGSVSRILSCALTALLSQSDHHAQFAWD